jgi:hypothetical protein
MGHTNYYRNNLWATLPKTGALQGIPQNETNSHSCKDYYHVLLQCGALDRPSKVEDHANQ